MEEKFNNIYSQKKWIINKNVKSISGPGSDDEQTKKIIIEIPKLLEEYNIKSIFDCPCGDFNWMNRIVNNNNNYTGGDIVEKLIEENKNKYPNINFIKFDISKNDIKNSYDLIICRDLFVHFSYSDIKKTLSNIKKSNCKYILMTTFPNKTNRDCKTSDWRPLNFQKEPFNFPEPLMIINEGCTEGELNFTDKSLGLWEIKNINENFISSK